MICPACTQDLRSKNLFGVDLDECPDCEGLWFDEGELMQLLPVLKASTAAPELDLQIVHEKPVHRHPNPQRKCPRCHTLLINYNYGYDSNILLDRCPDCRGIWMDRGELLGVIRYAKGNPKLDRLAAAVADHAVESLSIRGMGEGLHDYAARAGLPGIGGAAHLLAALLEIVYRTRRG